MHTHIHYNLLNEVINSIDSRLSFHDFRVKKIDDRRILVFDLVTPIDNMIKDEIWLQQITDKVKEKNPQLEVEALIDSVHNRFSGEK